jgi:hypothetical protein
MFALPMCDQIGALHLCLGNGRKDIDGLNQQPEKACTDRSITCSACSRARRFTNGGQVIPHLYLPY